MREILFRGKRKDNGEWVEGFYHYTNYINPTTREVVETGHYILPVAGQDAYCVIPETVGQYTGLTDMNGKKIFEGDIVYNGVFRTSVEFCNGRFAPFNGEHNIFFADECVVIGNIHDNPELLKEKE